MKSPFSTCSHQLPWWKIHLITFKEFWTGSLIAQKSLVYGQFINFSLLKFHYLMKKIFKKFLNKINNNLRKNTTSTMIDFTNTTRVMFKRHLKEWSEKDNSLTIILSEIIPHVLKKLYSTSILNTKSYC